MSYDSQNRRWVRNGVDNSGERNAASSTGMNGDVWVWENEGVNIVLTQKGSNGFTVGVDVKESGGTRRVVDGHCTRI